MELAESNAVANKLRATVQEQTKNYEKIVSKMKIKEKEL